MNRDQCKIGDIVTWSTLWCGKEKSYKGTVVELSTETRVPYATVLIQRGSYRVPISRLSHVVNE